MKQSQVSHLREISPVFLAFGQVARATPYQALKGRHELFTGPKVTVQHPAGELLFLDQSQAFPRLCLRRHHPPRFFLFGEFATRLRLPHFRLQYLRCRPSTGPSQPSLWQVATLKGAKM